MPQSPAAQAGDDCLWRRFLARQISQGSFAIHRFRRWRGFGHHRWRSVRVCRMVWMDDGILVRDDSQMRLRLSWLAARHAFLEAATGCKPDSFESLRRLDLAPIGDVWIPFRSGSHSADMNIEKRATVEMK